MQCPYIIIFDSQCSFCNASVDFIIKRDPKGLFCFASLHSRIAQTLIEEQGLDAIDSDTIILIKGGSSYLRAEAVYAILQELDGLCSFLRLFRFLGTSCNDALYRYIAKNRQKLFSKRSCRVPSPELRSRFLTE